MKIYTLYIKVLFAGIGLLFANQGFGQDTSTDEKLKCESLKSMELNNTYKGEKIYSGYYIKCNTNDEVINIQLFEKGNFINYVELIEVDSVLNKLIELKQNCGHAYTCDPEFSKKIKGCPQINESGNYKNGQFTGKKYIYDKNGLLDRIEIYKEGNYVGDAQMD